MDNKWKLISIVVSFLAIIVPSYVTYYTATETLKPQIEVQDVGQSNLTSFFPWAKENVELRIGGEKIDSLNVAIFTLRNIGKAPLLAKNIYENISITVEDGWRIVAISRLATVPPGIEFEWKRVNDRKFAFDISLLNPNDSVTINVYTVKKSNQNSDKLKLEYQWSSRVVNMSDISVYNPEKVSMEISGIMILLYGWAVPFIIVIASLVIVLTLLLSIKAEILPILSSLQILYIIFIVLLAYSVGEVLAFYIFMPKLNYFGAGFLNLTILVLQSVFLLYLLVKIYRDT